MSERKMLKGLEAADVSGGGLWTMDVNEAANANRKWRSGRLPAKKREETMMSAGGSSVGTRVTHSKLLPPNRWFQLPPPPLSA